MEKFGKTLVYQRSVCEERNFQSQLSGKNVQLIEVFAQQRLTAGKSYA